MKYLSIFIIAFYQRFISPYKGFKCAHHVLHGQETCSNSIKSLILENGFLVALPLIRRRFEECRSAYSQLRSTLAEPQRADLPCDLPCDVSIGDCGNGSAFECMGFCDWPFGTGSLSKRVKRLIGSALIVLLLVMSYVFYGRQIDSIYLTDLGEKQQSIVTRLIQRSEPKIRILLLVDGKKHYSEIVEFAKLGYEYKLLLDKPISHFDIQRMEILDARLNVATELIVVGQVLEVIDEPLPKGSGERFSYRFKRRWHF